MPKAIKIIAIIAVIVLLAGLSVHRHTKYTVENATVQAYIVQSGDTLWGIAKQYAPEGMRYDDYIYQIQQYNGISADLMAGQTIEILEWEVN